MPFNPAQFVFQPRPLQQFDFGAGFRDLAEGRMKRTQMAETERSNKATLAENQAQRQDTNSLAAANFAKDRANTEYEAANKKYMQRLKIGELMHSASQANDQATVEALAPIFQELGGTYRREEGDTPGLPNYFIEAGNEPTRGPLDVQGARSDIYGGPKMGKPFSMSSPAGPGALFTEQNPFDSPATPGASAAAAGPLPEAPPSPAVAAPPPEEQPEQLGGPPLEAAPAPPPAPQASGGQPQLTGPNPLNTPAFSPYSVNMSSVAARNRAQTQPMMQALVEAAPVDFRGRAEAFARNASTMGTTPERQNELMNPLLEQLTGMYRTEVGADLAGQRMANTRDRQDQLAEQKASDTFFKRKTAAQNYGVKILGQNGIRDLKTRQLASRQVQALLKTAGSNGQAAYQLIGKMHDMADKGIMTKDDYIQAAHGNVNLITKIERAFTKELFTPEGLDPDALDDIVEVANLGAQLLRQETYDQAQRIYSLYSNTDDEAERAGYAQVLRGTFDPEYIPEELTDENQIPEQPEVYRPPPPASNSLGTSSVSKTLDGSPKVSPHGTVFGPGRIGPKPPRKKPISQEVDDLLK